MCCDKIVFCPFATCDHANGRPSSQNRNGHIHRYTEISSNWQRNASAKGKPKSMELNIYTARTAQNIYNHLEFNILCVNGRACRSPPTDQPLETTKQTNEWMHGPNGKSNGRPNEERREKASQVGNMFYGVLYGCGSSIDWCFRNVFGECKLEHFCVLLRLLYACVLAHPMFALAGHENINDTDVNVFAVFLHRLSINPIFSDRLSYTHSPPPVSTRAHKSIFAIIICIVWMTHSSGSQIPLVNKVFDSEWKCFESILLCTEYLDNSATVQPTVINKHSHVEKKCVDRQNAFR